MEITVIHGQMHHGSTWHVSQKLVEYLTAGGGAVHEFYLPKDGPDYCVGCCRCVLEGAEKCPQAEKTAAVREAMLRSEILVVDSPTYCYEMTGQLKTLFDHYPYLWMIHRPRKEMFMKIGVSVSTAAGGGAGNVTKSIARQFFFWGVPKTHRLHFNVRAAGWEQVPEKTKRQIDEKCLSLAKKIERSGGRAMPGIRTRALFGFMRFMQRQSFWNKTDSDYWRQNGWLGKGRPWR